MHKTLDAATIEHLGTTPYTDLTQHEMHALAAARPLDLFAITEIANNQEPPNTTTLVAISAICLAHTYSDTTDVQAVTGSLSLYHQAIKSFSR